MLKLNKKNADSLVFSRVEEKRFFLIKNSSNYNYVHTLM